MIRPLRDPYATSLPPELTGGGEAAAPEQQVESAPAPTSQDLEADESEDFEPDDDFDPYDHTVDEVVTYAAAHPEEIDTILAAERDGKRRITLINQLEAM